MKEFQQVHKEKALQGVKDGLIQFFRSISHDSPLPDQEFLDTEKRTLYVSGVHFPTLNGVFEKEDKPLSKEDIEAILRKFKTKNLPFIWFGDQPILEKLGFQLAGSMKGIYLDLSTRLPSDRPAPEGFSFKRVTSSEELKIFHQILTSSLPFNAQAAKEFFSILEAAMQEGTQSHYLGFYNQTPISTLTLSTNSSRSAGLWNASTVKEYREKGFMSSLCYALILEAQRLGFHELMAFLPPKGGAMRVHKTLGVELGAREACEIPFYVHGMNANEIGL